MFLTNTLNCATGQSAREHNIPRVNDAGFAFKPAGEQQTNVTDERSTSLKYAAQVSSQDEWKNQVISLFESVYVVPSPIDRE